MNLDKLTIKSQETIQNAQQLAMEKGHQGVTDLHLLKSLIAVDDNVVPFILKKLSANAEIIGKAIDAELKSQPSSTGGEQYFTNEARSTIQKAFSFLKEYGDEYVSVEHLFLALLSSKSRASQILSDAGVNIKDVKSAIKELRNPKTNKTNIPFFICLNFCNLLIICYSHLIIPLCVSIQKT